MFIPLLAPVLAAGPLSGDGEWAPELDPQTHQCSSGEHFVIGDPDSGSHLFLERIEIALPANQGASAAYRSWISHFHQGGSCSTDTGFGSWATDFTFGDLDGDPEDDFVDEVVFTMAGEAVVAADLSIQLDGSGNPVGGTLTPLWLWTSDYSDTVPRDGNGFPTSHDECAARGPSNALVANVAAEDASDSTNEVVFMARRSNGAEELVVLRHDPSNPGTPELVASLVTPYSVGESYHNRLALCTVRDTGFPRDIVASGHQEGRLLVFSLGAGGNPAEVLSLEYVADPFTTPGLRAKCHESNWTDIDGDGFDEFFVNGLIDFVDRDPSGQPVATNVSSPIDGIVHWQIVEGLTQPPAAGQTVLVGGKDGHTDMCYVADWDADRPGLEVLAVVELGKGGVWQSAFEQSPSLRTAAMDLLFDADCGTLIHEWTMAPASDGQSVFGGNWTASHPGLESILSPKDLAGLGQVIPPGQSESTGSYVSAARVTADPSDQDFELLAIDGALYESVSGPFEQDQTLRVRAGGPWGHRTYPIDWDGSYEKDEILSFPRLGRSVTLYELLDKTDLDLGDLPPGLPTKVQVESSVPPIQRDTSVGETGPDTWYWYFQGTNGDERLNWGWNDGPGRGSHVFHKLGEDWPEVPIVPGMDCDGFTGQVASQGAIMARPYDLLGDHREELVAMTTKELVIYFHTLPGPILDPRPSPKESFEYIQHRQSSVIRPFEFVTGGVAIQELRIRPTSTGTPTRAFGLPVGASRQLEAHVVFENGDEVNVSSSVTWVQDAYSQSWFSQANGLVTANGFGGTGSGSARIHAELGYGGQALRSEPVYAFSSTETEPAVLLAGFGDSWISTTAPAGTRDLLLTAWVAQRDDVTLEVQALRPDQTPVTVAGQDLFLVDDGSAPDAVAGDGVYTAIVPADELLTPSDLIVVRARTTAGNELSTPWPYMVKGSTGQHAWPDLPAAGNQPAPAMAYEAPRIRAFGYRGYSLLETTVLELVLDPTPLDPAGVEEAFAALQLMSPTGGTGGPYSLQVPLVPLGGHRFERVLGLAVDAPAVYLPQMFARSVAPDGTVRRSDWAPRVVSHVYPAWGPQDAAPQLGFCLEPIGW